MTKVNKTQGGNRRRADVLTAGCSQSLFRLVMQVLDEFRAKVHRVDTDETVDLSRFSSETVLLVGDTFSEANSIAFVQHVLQQGLRATVVAVCRRGNSSHAVGLERIGVYNIIEDGPLMKTKLMTVMRRVFWMIDNERRLESVTRAVEGAERNYKKLFNKSPVGVFLSDSFGRPHSVNIEMARLLGASSPEEVLQEYANFGDQLYVIPGRRRELVKALSRNGQILNFEFEARHLRLGRTWFAMNASIRKRLPDGSFLIDGFVRDISERKRAEAAIRYSERKYRHLFDHAGEGIMLIDSDLLIADVNLAAVQLFGVGSSDDLTGRSFVDFLSPEETSRFRVADAESGIGEVERREMRLLRADGVEIYVAATFRYNSDDRFFQVILSDITTRRNLEKTLRAARDSAESANRSKSDFLANMSHEIRTPLNGIMGMLQLLWETPLNEDQADYVDSALMSCARLTSLLGDIMDISKIEAGRVDLACEPLDLGSILDSVRHLFGISARQAGIRLKVRCESPLQGAFMGDSVKIQQILNNLVGNAIKFTTEGTVDVELGLLQHPEKGKVNLLISVNDTGIGMCPAMFDHVFKPFTQVDSSFTREFQGAGLGLSIVKNLVQLMGGALQIESLPGEGTSVHCCLTLERKESAVLMPSLSFENDERQKKGRRVLVVEDDYVNRTFLVRVLEKQKYRVRAVDNGESALNELRTRMYDAVLMDVHMPVMGGVEAAKAIRAGKAGTQVRNIPIVAVTACAVKGERERFIEAGMNDYLPKPVDMDSLYKVLECVG